MKLTGWTRLWIVAGALVLTGCSDEAREKELRDLEELKARTDEQVRLLEEIQKTLEERFPESAGASQPPDKDQQKPQQSFEIPPAPAPIAPRANSN